MPLRYQSGEEIRKGDRVLFHGQAGEIELVADPGHPEPETEWYITEYKRGVMVNESKVFGTAFVPEPEEAEDLIFVSRKAIS